MKQEDIILLKAGDVLVRRYGGRYITIVVISKDGTSNYYCAYDGENSCHSITLEKKDGVLECTDDFERVTDTTTISRIAKCNAANWMKRNMYRRLNQYFGIFGVEPKMNKLREYFKKGYERAIDDFTCDGSI